MSWSWFRKKNSKKPTSFLGIRVGMTEKEAVAHLEELARARGESESTRVTTAGDSEGGGSVYAEGPVWHVYVSTNDMGDVAGRMGKWRLSPSGLHAGIEWMRWRIAE